MSFSELDVFNAAKARVDLAEKGKSRSIENVETLTQALDSSLKNVEALKQALDAAKRQDEAASKELKEAQDAFLDVTTPIKRYTETEMVVDQQEDDDVSKADDHVSIFDVYSIIVEGSRNSTLNGLYERENKKESHGAPVFRNEHNFVLRKYEYFYKSEASWCITRFEGKCDVVYIGHFYHGQDADPLNNGKWLDSQLKLIADKTMDEYNSSL